LSGYEVARHIRQIPGLESLRLIALTGWGQDEHRQRALDAGFDHHLTKPVDPAQLGRLLQ
jgi:CheY-like chemotaxis protein